MATKAPPPSPERELRDAILALAVVAETEHGAGFNQGLEEAVKVVDAFNARKLAGLAKLREQGRKTGGGVPYGFKLDKDGTTLVPLKAEQKVIAEATSMRDRGYSYRAIAKTLADRGFRARNGKRFDATQIRRMVDDASGKGVPAT